MEHTVPIALNHVDTVYQMKCVTKVPGNVQMVVNGVSMVPLARHVTNYILLFHIKGFPNFVWPCIELVTYQTIFCVTQMYVKMALILNSMYSSGACIALPFVLFLPNNMYTAFIPLNSIEVHNLIIYIIYQGCYCPHADNALYGMFLFLRFLNIMVCLTHLCSCIFWFSWIIDCILFISKFRSFQHCMLNY